MVVPSQPGQFATVSTFPNGVRTYFPFNGTIQKIESVSTPTNPSGFSTWNNIGTLAEFGVTDVAQQSAIAGVGYLSPQTGALIQRLFYQTTNGDIRTVFHPGITGEPGFLIDPTIIASNVPLGTPISAMQQASPGLGQPVSCFYTTVFHDASAHRTSRKLSLYSGPMQVVSLTRG